jgi:hypothetical protein
VAVVAVLTADAEAVNVAVVAPAATVTDDGTVTAVLLLERVIANPPVAAAAVSVTVHESVPAPAIVAFVHVSALSAACAARLIG